MRTTNTKTSIVLLRLHKSLLLYFCIVIGTLINSAPTQAQTEISPIISLLLLDGITINGKVVFVTDAISKGNLGGLDGADATCQQEATAAGFSGVFRAWLSDSNTTASERLAQSTEPYFLPDATKVADDWADLTDGTLQTAINLNAKGRAPAQSCLMNNVWTSTTVSGARSSTHHCNNWTSDSNSEIAGKGVMTRADSLWTENGLALCNFASLCGNGNRDEGGRIYCLQQ